MIKWEKNLELGIREIDSQHQMLIEVLNQVYEACGRGEGLVQVKDSALFLEWYVDKHFSDEEIIQERINYPAIKQHIKRHRVYQTRVKELLENLKSEEVTTEHIAKLTIYLQTMIKEHIKQDDKALGYYINNNEIYKEVLTMVEVQVDPLTGVLAKDEFRALMNQKFQKRDNKNQFYIVMTIDHFGNVNRTYGYDIGDEVIIYVAGILHVYQGDNVLIGRNHQDQFVMFIEESDDVKTGVIVKEIVDKMYQGFKRAGSIIPLSLSIGVVEIQEDTIQKHIKQNGIIALNKAQQAGGNQCVYFEKYMYEEIQRKSQIVNQLQTYSAKDHLFVVYQPIYDVKTQSIQGAEALLRMKSEAEGLISPAEFIPLAEKNNLIVDVGYFCIRQVCRDLKKILSYNTAIRYISINLSIEQIKQGDFVEKVYQIAQEEGVDLANLYFELTESILVKDFSMISEVISHLKTYGCKILLDDFGSGYSALSYLSRIDTDILKIDKTLIEGIGEKENVLHVIKHTIAMAKDLGMLTVIEGVETEEELILLEKLNVDKIQGYYISKPLALDQFVDVIKS